ncbi:MAG: alpha-ketoglutarate-dependent dioxygenase AlkB, partial [Myxococcota bacterium]
MTLQHEQRVRDLGKGAYIDYFPSWLPIDEASAALTALVEELEWDEVSIRAKEKVVIQPRLTSWAGELPYRYSGQTLQPRPVPTRLQALQSAVMATTGVEYNHAVINYYRHGDDHMGMHADDEPQLGRNPNIAAISLGAVRTFVLRPKGRKRYWVRYRLAHGSLLVMRGTVQHRWYHGVPKASPSGPEATPVGPR